MKTTNKVLLTTIAVSLIACGGGGSSSSKGSSISTTKTPTTKKPAVTTPTKKPAVTTTPAKKPAVTTPTKKPAVTTPTKKPGVTTTPTPSTNTSNGFFKIKVSGYSIDIKDQDEDINTLKVNYFKNGVGSELVNVTLIPKGFSVGKFFTKGGSSRQRIVSGSDYSHVRFGLIQSKTDDIVTFAQGYSTLDMPVTGKAVYKGSFVSGKDFYSPNFNDVINGDITFNVDFAGKTITGDIAENDHISFKKGLNAKINGNTFSSGNLAGYKELEGYFYGPNAAELGGTYNDNKARASFGAKKQ